MYLRLNSKIIVSIYIKSYYFCEKLGQIRQKIVDYIFLYAIILTSYGAKEHTGGINNG